MKVNLFIPCFIDQFHPQTAFNTISLLKKAGCEVLYNPEQTCCGQPAFNAGFWDDAKKTGQKFLHDFAENIPVVSPSASCIGMVKNSYNDLFTNTKDHNLCRGIQAQSYEISDFLVNVLGVDYFGAELEARAVYHDSCSALRSCSIKEEPRQLLKNVAGFQLIESPDAEVCCGFGGTFTFNFSTISAAMAEQKVQHALDLGADLIVSTDSSCLMHLQGYIDKHKLPIRTLHLVDVLVSGWPNI